MKDAYKELSDPKLLKLVADVPALNKLWSEVEQSLPNVYLVIRPMESLQPYFNIDLTASCFAACTVYPIPQNIKPKSAQIKDYFAVIAVAKDYTIADIAHELGHFYVHIFCGFPWLWDTLKTSTNHPEILQRRYFTSRVYDIAVHPIIDRLLERRSLFIGVQERLYNTFKEALKKYLKNPTQEKFDWFVLRTIEMQQRLKIKQWKNILLKFGSKPEFIRILDKIKDLPPYPAELNPFSVEQYFYSMIETYGYQLKDLHLELLFDSPFL